MPMGGFDKVFCSRSLLFAPKRPAASWRRVLVAVLVAAGIAGGGGLAPPGLGAQLPPDQHWMTLETPHFRVTYPAGLLDLARRAGDRAETAWTELSREFMPPPKGKVDLVVTDHADVSNGFTRVVPSNRIIIFAPPPVDGFGLPFMDEWLELVITHELTHVFHEDYAGNPGKGLRKVFGRMPLEWPFFPGTAEPDWVAEGIATYYESDLTGAGRVRGTYHEMIARTAILEDQFESIDQSSGDSPRWPGGERYYAYGSLFLQRLADLYGQEAVGAFVHAFGGEWIPYRLNAAAEDAFGVSFSDAWEEWKRDLQLRYAALQDSLALWAPLTVGESLTSEGYYAWDPELSPDGKVLAFTRQDGRSDSQVRLIDLATGKQAKLARTNSVVNLGWTPSGDVIYSQLDYLDSYRLRRDLFRTTPGGRTVRITRGARLDHPDVAPDGNRVVAVQEAEGANRLVIVDLASGSVSPITEYRSEELWAYPRWSPDGRWIAASRWRVGYYDLVLLDPRGEVLSEVTGDRAIDNSPTWSPDGRWLLWASDRSGIPNLYAVPVDLRTGGPGDPRQVTNFLGGAAYPSVDPEGAWIYFSSYHADGWHIERIPFAPDEWFAPQPLHPRFRADVDSARYARRAEGVERAYSPWPTIRPTYWAPTYREGDRSGDVQVLKPGFGLFTSGNDVVGRHAFAASATLSSGTGAFNGGASYSYAGLGNPILGMAVSQSHDADARPWAGVTQEGDTVPLFLVKRERAVGAGVTFLRRRSRSVASFGLSGYGIWDHRFFLERDLTESTRFGLRRPDTRLAEGRVTGSFGNARRYAYSISPEDGVSMYLRARIRRELDLPDSLRTVTGFDRSYGDLVGQVALYKSFRGPGFANHVLAARGSAGAAGGAGADAFHFEVGGASGARIPLQFLDIGQGLLFPVRGYPTATRWGRYAWTGTVEYRFPLWLVNRGAGLFPFFLNWMSGAVFADAGNAWGPELDLPGFQAPRRSSLLSVGGELLVRALPLWFQSLDLRVGLAAPLVEGDGAVAYLRLGPSF